MRTNLFILLYLILGTITSYSQSSANLKLVGSNFSYSKGNIDVDLLTEIIQQKQEEVAQRAFQNLVFANFDKKSGAKKSFTTYYYIYNLLHTLTVEKNKTVITRQVLNNVLEYCLVSGFTHEYLKKRINDQKSYNNKTDINTLFEKISSNSNEVSNGNMALKDSKDDEDWKAYNLYLDMAYDIFLKDDSKVLQQKGLFKLFQDSPSLKKWYETDNAYLVNQNNSDLIKKQRAEMEKAFKEFIVKSFGGVDLINVYKELETNDFKQESLSETQYNAMKKILRKAISYLKNYSENNVIGSISEYLLDYTIVEFKQDSTKKGILYVDAEGLISSLHDRFATPNKRSPMSGSAWFIAPKPFLIIGAAYSGALQSGNNLLGDKTTPIDLNSLYYASEKVGIKFTFMDKRYTRSFQPGEEYMYKGKKYVWIRPQKEPLLIRQELMFYGSGLLYNIVDIKSSKNFNYALAGIGYGFTFFNGLNFNLGITSPINAMNGVEFKKKLFYNASFDIPIIEYISALRKKKKI